MERIDRDALFRLFERLDDASQSKQKLCVIGAASVLTAGHTQRQTQDIYVWRPASTINDRDLAMASAAVGIGLNPTELAVNDVYLQTISPGIVQLPAYEQGRWATGEMSEPQWQGHQLAVVAPPAAIIVASKLVRCDDRDIEDCAYLMEAKRVTLDDVRKAVAKIPDATARETAKENLVFLSIMDAKSSNRPERERDDEGTER